jgi:hypothetical protein
VDGAAAIFFICRFNDLIRRWTNPPWRTFNESLARQSLGDGGTRR